MVPGRGVVGHYIDRCITAPGVSEAEIIHSFNTIDANKNGVISREEFMAAAEDFFCGVEETELSKVFLGRLVD